MEATRTLISRLEVRDFATDQRIPEKDIQAILEAAYQAPSAMNRQPWKFKLIKSKKILQRLAIVNLHAKFVGNAGFAVAVYTTQGRFGEIDATRAITLMQAVAWLIEPRIGSCFNWGWNAADVSKILGPIEDHQLVTIIPFGYPEKKKFLGKKNRKPREQVIQEAQ